MKNIYFTYFPSVKKNTLGITRALAAKKNALGINRALVAKKSLASLSVICLTLLIGFCGSVWGASPLTVASGSTTSNYVPISGNYCDEVGTRTQVIYPAALLAEMADNEITGLKFYSSQSSVSYSGVVIKIRLAEVSATTLSGFLSPDFTEVYSGGIAISGYEMNFTLSDAYPYGGGNLLLETEVVTAGTYNFPYFYGVSATSAAYGNKVYYGSAGGSSFRPKTSFTYAAQAVTSCPKPKSLAGVAASSSSATITWTRKGTETAWDLQYSSNNGVSWTTLNLTTSNVSLVGDNCTYILSGLSAQTTYKVQVRANCGGGDGESDYTSPTSFTTLCGSISSFPWTENFESGTANTVMLCWDNSASTASEISTYPERIWGVYSYSSNKMLRMYNYYVHTGTALINTPTIELPAAPKLTFKYSNKANCGNLSVKISTNGGSTFTNLKNYASSGTTDYTNPGSFTTATIDLSTYANQSVIIQFFANANYGSGAIFIDDVHIESAQDCNTPQSVTMTSRTSTTASFSWTARAGVPTYQYCVVARGAAADWSGNLKTNTNSCTATGLTPSTDYDFYVKCVCGGSVSAVCQFTTDAACPSVTGVTLSNKLYNGVTVNWTTSSATNCDVRYKAGSGAWTSAGTNISGTSKAITGLSVGTTYTFEVKPSCSADGWVAAGETYTPTCPAVGALTLSGQKYNGVTVAWSAVAGISTYNLRYRKGSDAWTTVNDIAALTYTITSGLVTNQAYTIEVQTECGGTWSSTTYNPIAEAPTVAGANSITETSISAVCTDMSGNGAIGHQYILVACNAAEDWSSPKALTPSGTSVTGLTLGTDYDLYVRAVYGGIYSASTKKQFTTVVNKPTGLTRGTLTSTSVQFSWTAGGGATQYQYLCLPSGTTPTESHWSSSTLTSLTSVTVEGLSANTTYVFHVRAYHNGKTSTRVYSAAFTTLCGTEDLPYSQNFGTSAGIKPACWTCDRWSSTAGYWYTYLVEGTNYGLRYYGNNSSQTADIQTPSIYLSDKADLTFKYSNNYSSHPIPSSVIISNGVTTKTVNLPTTASGTLTSYTIDLSNVSGTNFTGTTVTITFRGAASSYASYSYFRLDDVAITAKSCTTPTLNTPSATSDGAIVTWTDSRADEWSIRYRTRGVGDWTVVDELSVKTYTITGLASGVEYEVQVRNDCSSASSAWTASKYFTPVSCQTVTGVSLSDPIYNGITVSWTTTGVTDCDVRYSANGGSSWTSAGTNISGSSKVITGLIANSTYTIEVKPSCGGDDTWVAAATTYTPVYTTPSEPVITSIRDVSASASWGEVADADGYDYVVMPGEAAANWSDKTHISGNANHSATLSGLTAETNYTLYVRATYGGNAGNAASSAFSTVCMAPTALTQTDVTTSSVTFTWSAGGAETQYQWACKLGSTAPSAGDWSEPLDANVRTYMVSELNDGANYTFYVRSYYREGVYSSAVSLAFTTECGVKQLDYIENFEGGNPPCWTTTLEEWSTLGNHWEVVDDEGHQMRFNAKTNSATINYLIMPQIYLFTEAELSFRVKNVYYPVSSPEYVQGFVVVTDGETEREFPLMNAIPFTKQTIDLAEFTGKTVTVKFYSPDKLTHTAWIELDDVAVKAVDTWIFTNNTGDGLWTTKGNWDKGIKEDRIPAITDDVSIRKPATVNDEHATAKSIVIDHSNGNTGKITIQALKGLEVAGTIQLNTGSSLTSTTPADLILESSEGGNASLIFNNSNADQASVSLYSKASIEDGVKNYQYIGVPVNEANALYNYYGSWMYSWSDKGSGYGWKKVPNGGIVNAWTGYCITQEAPTTYAIEGTLVPTTSQDIAVPASENMVVGNSWTAPIDINAFEDGDFENLDGNVYFFNTGVDKTGEGGTAKTRYAGSTYVTVPIHSAPYTGDDHIASMQGFFVKSNGSAGTLHLNYAKHVRGTTRESIIGDALHAPKRGEATEMDEPVVLKIKVSGENYDDKLVLLAREDFSEGFDNGWDGDKWDGNESAQYIYTPDSEGTENSVSAVPELEGTVIGFRAGEDDEYTMYFDYLNGDEKLYLWDTETGDYTVIKTGYAYAFTTADKEKHARFIITRSNGQDVSTGLTSTASQGEGAKAKKLLIENKMYIMVDGMLFDATGKELR